MQRTPAQTYEVMFQYISHYVKGRDHDNDQNAPSTIDLLLTSLFTGGHVLLEDYPGSGKTYLAKILSESIDFTSMQSEYMTGHRRIQCMVDLLPTDVTGAIVKSRDQWVVNHGPLFSHIVLVDEINRTTPKVQSAFLEAMAEKQITIDKNTYELEPIFFLIATQNPHDRVGTFELPYAQLDRFLFKRILTPISKEALREVIKLDSQDDTSLPTVCIKELCSAIRELTRPLSSQILEDDLLNLHAIFTGLVATESQPSSKYEEINAKPIAPQCSLSPRTLRSLKRAVDFRVNLDRARTGTTRSYATERHLTPLLYDLLRHRIILKDYNKTETDKNQLILSIIQDVLEAREQSKGKRYDSV